MIQIEPVTVRIGVEANNVVITQGGYILGSNGQGKCKIEFLHNQDKYDEKTVIIPSEIMQNWTDDEPLIDYVFEQIGLVKKEINTDIYPNI